MGTKVGVCFWVDNDSIGMLGFYFQTVSQVKADFIKARSEIETRG